MPIKLNGTAKSTINAWDKDLKSRTSIRYIINMAMRPEFLKFFFDSWLLLASPPIVSLNPGLSLPKFLNSFLIFL